MDIKYPPFINLRADLTEVRTLLGRVIIVASVKGKEAQLILEQAEATKLVSKIQKVLAAK